MARRKRKRKYSGNGGGLGSLKTIGRSAGMGLVGAMLGVAVAQRVAPQYSDIGRVGGAFLLGGPVGAVSTVLLQGMPSLGGSSGSREIAV